MAGALDTILKKLKTDTAYVRLFRNAFSDGAINSQHMLKALAQFTGSIQSYSSKYDKVKNGEDTFTVSEKFGYKTFLADCNACHKEPLFTDNSYRNNGLLLNEKLQDKGRMAITGNPADSLKFKVPSLRNISLTFPYMHDGRLYTLSKVIEHYRTGINISQPTLDPLLKKRIAMTNQEKTDLLSFLLALKDEKLMNDVRFKQPD